MKKLSWLSSGAIFGVIYAFLYFCSSMSGSVTVLQPVVCCIVPFICIFWITFPVLSGYLASRWEKEPDNSLKVGLLSGLSYGVIVGIVFILSSVLSSVISTTSTAFFTTSESDPEIIQGSLDFLSGVLGDFLCGSLCCICFLIKDVLFGGLGGIIEKALRKG